MFTKNDIKKMVENNELIKVDGSWKATTKKSKEALIMVAFSNVKIENII